MVNNQQIINYRISANSFRGNYSFLKLKVRPLFKGGNYSKEESIVFQLFLSIHNLNSCRILCMFINQNS